MQLMVRLYGTYPPVRILKAHLYRTHDSSHDWTGIVRMNATFHPINKLHHHLDFLMEMDSHDRYPVNYYNVNNTIICKKWLYIARMHMLVHCSVNISHVRSYYLYPQVQNFNLPICVVSIASIWIENNHHRFVLKEKSCS